MEHFPILWGWLGVSAHSHHLVDTGSCSSDKNCEYNTSSNRYTQDGKNWTHVLLLFLMLVCFCNSQCFWFCLAHLQDSVEVLTGSGEVKERACDSLIMCIVTTLNQGLRNGGGIGDILRAPSSTVSSFT